MWTVLRGSVVWMLCVWAVARGVSGSVEEKQCDLDGTIWQRVRSAKGHTGTEDHWHWLLRILATLALPYWHIWQAH